jgi:DNA repair photolyase
MPERMYSGGVRPLPLANPPNPWAMTDIDYDEGEAPHQPLEVYEDRSRTVLSKNDSPDLFFKWTINPYRGCMHACAYCYARPSHEYLSFGAGTDFDRKIVVKTDAPKLLREAFDKKSWRGELVVMSGVTDCYQPLESTYQLTRACLQVCAEYKNPVAIVTKSPLIERDIDVLLRLNEVTHVSVAISIPFWNEANCRAIEPFVTTPKRRLKIIERLAAAGVPVGVNVAPIIPGLSDEDMPAILEAAAAAGAKRAHYVLLRLPGPVKKVFEERLRAALPLRADKVLARLREAHDGKLYNATFGERGVGEGPYAEMIGRLFRSTVERLGMNVDMDATTIDSFARPTAQLALF